MIRKGRFALWSDREFELVSYQRQYYLQSENPLDLKRDFKIMNNNGQVFVKQVSLNDLEDAYEIIPFAMIGGYRFAVEGFNEKSGKVTLVTNNPFVKEKMDVRPYGKFEYIVELPLGEVEVEEDRVPILGFEGLYP
ncbi:MAG: hypothetical protein ABS920_14000 [Sporosarcina sp.]